MVDKVNNINNYRSWLSEHNLRIIHSLLDSKNFSWFFFSVSFTKLLVIYYNVNIFSYIICYYISNSILYN